MVLLHYSSRSLFIKWGGEGLLNAMLSGIILDGSPGSQVKKHVPKSTSSGVPIANSSAFCLSFKKRSLITTQIHRSGGSKYVGFLPVSTKSGSHLSRVQDTSQMLHNTYRIRIDSDVGKHEALAEISFLPIISDWNMSLPISQTVLGQQPHIENLSLSYFEA